MLKYMYLHPDLACLERVVHLSILPSTEYIPYILRTGCADSGCLKEKTSRKGNKVLVEF